ncbi:MAG: transporter [Acidobacteria bacterium]|nr:transporter [Acidobacteriota bacterium]
MAFFFKAVCVFLVSVLPVLFHSAHAQSAGESPIQDNSFLVEEAYNQEFGVVQHISGFTRFWNSKDWAYSFTQEWPVPGHERSQVSYTLTALHAGDFSNTGAGFGDVMLHYRYQLWGSGDTRAAFSPRVSLIFPTGDPALGRGVGGVGVQTNLPLSLVLHRKLVSHWNAGATFVPNAQDAAGNRAFSAGYNLGQSFIWLVHSRFNVMMEAVYGAGQAVIGPNRTTWERSLLLMPGIRWAHNFDNGLQIVPGIGVPLGVGPSAGEKGVFLYLSFEHPFRVLQKK